MKKIYIIFLLFCVKSFSQNITFVNSSTSNCNNANFIIYRPSTPNGVYSMIINIRNKGSQYVGFSSFNTVVSVNMVGDYGTFSVPISSFGGYLGVEVVPHPFGGSTIFDGIAGSFYKDLVYFNYPLALSLNTYITPNICTNTAFELGLSDSTSFVGPFPSGCSSLYQGIFNSNLLYKITILVSGANSGTFTDIVDNTTAGFWGPFDNIDVPASILLNSGVTRFSVIQYEELGNDTISQFGDDCNTNIVSFSPLAYFSEYNVLAPPNISGTNAISVTSPICLGNNGMSTFSSTTLANGTFDITYTLTGSNSGSFTAYGVVFSSGTSSFSIPSLQLSNLGNTTVELNSILNTGTVCSSFFTVGSVTSTFNIVSYPNLSGTNTISVTEPLCLGNNGTVTFNASSLANGTYSITYDLFGTNSGTFTATNVVFASGTGTFTIPSSTLVNSGHTTISLTSVADSSITCSTVIPSFSITDSFVINILPNVSGTNSVTILDICKGFGATAQFTSTSLANFSYNLVYTLSGANSGTFTATNVVFASGTGTFTIPPSALTNSGTTIITLTTISNIATSCQSSF